MPVDFSERSVAAVQLARSVAPEADVVLMHVVNTPFEGRLRLAGVDESKLARYRGDAMRKARQRLDEVAAVAGLAERWVALVAHETAVPWMQIVQQEQAQECDLIVMGKHGRHLLEELLLGGTTRMVIAEGNADVLVSTRKIG